MAIGIGRAEPEEAADFLWAMGRSFGFDSESDQTERFSTVFEWDRSVVARDNGKIVGTAGAFSLDLTVPGATMACGGTTVVSVLPSHRRQGVLRQMMAFHLDEVRQREEPIAGLWASDSAIYGRFGYGCAALGYDIEVERDHSRFHRNAPDPSPVRILAAEEAEGVLPDFYDRQRKQCPGLYGRHEDWWRLRRFFDNPERRAGGTAPRYAITEGDNGPTGYVQYRYKEKWEEGHGRGQVTVQELIGSSPESWAGLWRFVLDHDLTSRVVAPHRSVEEPLLELLAGRRRAKIDASDSLWIRVMDLKSALEGRFYAAEASAVIEVTDGAETTRWSLDLSPQGASVQRSDAKPDASMDLEDLGSCFMGWSRLASLGKAGRIEGHPAALSDLDRAFGWSPQPWCPEVF